MHEELDFTKSIRLVPRQDSWSKVVLRINKEQEQQKVFLIRKFSSFSIAASVLLIAGAIFLGISNTKFDETSTNASSLESLLWYSGLGSGQAVSSFSTTIDNYFPIGG